MKLKEFFEQYPKVAIAFSGGVDSAFLLYAAAKYAGQTRAYYVKTEFQPQFELEDARKIAEELHVDLKIITLPILSDDKITKNSERRCYYCKKRIFEAIKEAAVQDGFTCLLDGTNASDDAGDRPGMVALKELSVLSPLRMCNLTKQEIREESKEANLFTWDKPAYACLATRIPTNQIITQHDLERTEAAENLLFSLGFSDFRIRTMGNSARIQVQNAQLKLLMEKRIDILKSLKEMYESVLLDLEVRNES